MRRTFQLILSAVLFTAFSLAQGQEVVPGQILVRFRPNAKRVSRALMRLRGRVAKHLVNLAIDQVQLPRGVSVQAGVTALRSDPDVIFAEPNYVVRTFGDNDPFYPMQYDLRLISAPQAWGITMGSPAVLVGTLDTGVDLTHPDLAGQIADSRNFLSSGPALDHNGHGTHTAGTVAAITDNGIGVASLGSRTRLLVGKVVADDGQGSVLTVAQGIEWATDSGAKVITMSLGVSARSQTLEDAVNDAWNRGVVVVASAGNNGTTQRMYPAAFDNCIAVAATDERDQRCSFSSFGSWVHVAAPGKNIVSLYLGGGTAALSGTSMAAPHVAALAALLWANGARSNSSIRDAIINSGDPTTGFAAYPVGRINARRALLRLP